MNYRLFMALAATTMMYSSCNTSKQSLTYFNDLTAMESAVMKQIEQPVIIRPDDELLITVSSVTPSVTAEYNAPLVNPALASNLNVNTQPQLQTYIVNSSGDITMPVLGKIHVEGLTTDQLTDDLYERISKNVKDPYVRVELMNFSVNVLGEVRTPGQKIKPVGLDSFNVLEALAASGDMTEFSDRSNVIVLRKENGEITSHRLDLNDSRSMESPYFYLQQQDVIIVPPSQSRQSNARYDTNNSFKIQVVSTIVSALSVVASLVIALAVK